MHVVLATRPHTVAGSQSVLVRATFLEPPALIFDCNFRLRMNNSINYTVGWMRALSLEAIAATVLLDRECDGNSIPPAATHDNNQYTIGKVGKHSVIIA
ncbi:hypothetical protein LX36DRAFT_42391 [Colletotrichum falcatum]|nr:hypothetical protein LX36DRAFT_42391 [Colletotrichum falcatum]